MTSQKIGYLTQKDAGDRFIWSGIIFSIFEALGHEGEVEIVGPRPRPLWIRLLWQYIARLRWAFGQRLGVMQSIPLSLAYSQYFGRDLKKSSCDAVLAPIAACELAFLQTDKPFFFFSDATFQSLQGYYYKPSEISWLGSWQGRFLESRVAQRAAGLIFASQWAASRAVEDYGVDPRKVHVVPMGANFRDPPARESLRNGSSDGVCRLLFVSRDWNRKGGALAYEAMQVMRSSGIQAELTVVGCVPPKEFDDPHLHVIPSLDKKVPAEEEQLKTLFREADFFLLPTRAECFGIVFCEASAYGLPSISTKTGGVPSAVAEGQNGHLLPLDAGAEAYAKLMLDLWADPERYQTLRRTTRDRFERELNWGAWAKRVREIMRTHSEADLLTAPDA